MIRFRVDGLPGPGGSKSAFWNASLGRSVLVDAGGRKTKLWRNAVRFAGIEAMDGAPPMRGPVVLAIDIVMPRPGRHHRANRKGEALRPDAPAWHLQAPDATKLVRSTEDALTGIAWADDAQVVRQHVGKRWADGGEPAGAEVWIWQPTIGLGRLFAVVAAEAGLPAGPGPLR